MVRQQGHQIRWNQYVANNYGEFEVIIALIFGIPCLGVAIYAASKGDPHGAAVWGFIAILALVTTPKLLR
jgi:hypothetical protein